MKMRLHIYILWSFGLSLFFACNAQEPSADYSLNISNNQVDSSTSKKPSVIIPIGLQKLIEAYPEQNFKASSNALIWSDGDTLVYQDSINNIDKTFQLLLNQPDLEDQLSMPYPKGVDYAIPSQNKDPGRIRVEAFFLKMYGENKEAVRKNLVKIDFLGTQLSVTQINSIDKKLSKVAKELAKHPELKQYLENVGGTFNWRKIAGSNRLSTHSFGMTIDINVKYANYWRWAVGNKNEEGTRPIPYKNKIPLEIVHIFEQNGFIWGGKWYHYDTMHFEYRPELLIELETK
jgi:peptidoglycan L-alanyl-D-glutamate endopeptidase CwlK